MALTFDLLSIRDLFAKLQRDAAALKEEVTSDRLFSGVRKGDIFPDLGNLAAELIAEKAKRSMGHVV